MPHFSVELRSINDPDKTKKVEVDAPNKESARRIAAEGNWRVIGVESSPRKGRVTGVSQIKGKLLVRFCSSVGSQLKAQISLQDALTFYAARLQDRNLRAALGGVVEYLRQGEGAGRAFALVNVFDPIFVGLIKAGETSANMPDAFFGIARFNKIRLDATSRVKKAIAIPLATIIFVYFIFVAAMTNLTPKIEGMLMDFEQEPDPFSGAMFAVSHFVQATWIPFTLGMIVLTLVLIFARNIRTQIINILMAKFHMVKELIMSYRQLVFLSTFQMLYNNKIEVPEALETCSFVLRTNPMGDELRTVKEKFVVGEKLAKAIENYTSCDPEVSHMLGIGEETGTTGEQLNLLVGLYEDRLAQAIDVFSTRTQVIIFITAAILLGSCYVASYLPVILMGPKMLQSAG
jgi:type IV pilus assembly protein PilC